MSRGFVFKLEPVLEQRRREERERQREVAGLERLRLEAEDRLRDCQRWVGEARQDLREHLSGSPSPTGSLDSARQGSVSLASVRLQAGASLHLIARAQQTVLQLAGVHRKLEDARARLLEATTRRRAVELLRERKHAEFLLCEKRKEAAEVDEMNTMSHGRRARSTGVTT